MEPEETFALLDWVCENAGGEDVTPQSATASNVDEAAAEAYSKRMPVFDFHALEIPDGSELTFKDDATKKATVSGPKKVIFEGEETTLTPLTKRLLGVNSAVASVALLDFRRQASHRDLQRVSRRSGERFHMTGARGVDVRGD